MNKIQMSIESLVSFDLDVEIIDIDTNFYLWEITNELHTRDLTSKKVELAFFVDGDQGTEFFVAEYNNQTGLFTFVGGSDKEDISEEDWKRMGMVIDTLNNTITCIDFKNPIPLGEYRLVTPFGEKTIIGTTDNVLLTTCGIERECEKGHLRTIPQEPMRITNSYRQKDSINLS